MDKSLVFAGAGIKRQGAWATEIWTPRTTLGKIVERALAPHGYDVQINLDGYAEHNARVVSRGEADLGALGSEGFRRAYSGGHGYEEAGPCNNLRVIAAVHFPAWIGVAVRCETNITDLRQIYERQLPVRVVGVSGLPQKLILEHYGLSRELIESWGGRFMSAGYFSLSGFVTSGDFDVIIDAIYAAYTPEARHWWEASVLHNLRFLPLPSDLVQRICQETGDRPGNIPHQLMRGVEGDTPTVARSQHVIYSRDDLPDELAYLIARSLDEQRHLFREVFIPFSYDPATVADDQGLPWHPAAERYYREVGYRK